MNKNIVGYKLVSENLTGLGGPMGTESTSENWSRNLPSVERAKQVAEADYAKSCDGRTRKTIEWRGKEATEITSGDLRYVMYTITPIRIES